MGKYCVGIFVWENCGGRMVRRIVGMKWGISVRCLLFVCLFVCLFVSVFGISKYPSYMNGHRVKPRYWYMNFVQLNSSRGGVLDAAFRCGRIKCVCVCVCVCVCMCVCVLLSVCVCVC